MFFACSIFLLLSETIVGWKYKSDPKDLPYKNWMSYFQDFYVGDLPMIPGSHDSATVAVSPDEDWFGLIGWLYAQTQSTNIMNQLMLGVRLIDLRITVFLDAFDRPNEIYDSHTFKTNSTFTQSLLDVKTFLQQQPTEFVYLLVRIDAANPLDTALDQKRSFIESQIRQSGIPLASISNLTNVKVKDLAGKAVLIARMDNKTKWRLLPNTTTLPLVDWSTKYSVCDVWNYTSSAAGMARIASCFPQVPANTKETGIITGYALDGQFDQLWPQLTSPQITQWWLTNFQNNTDWVTRSRFPIGVFLIDFVNSTYMSIFLDYIMNFGYPYPYYGSSEPWTPGMNIPIHDSSAGFSRGNWFLAFIAIVVSIN